MLQTVDRPCPASIARWSSPGSDKRGTIYGIYDLSEQIGVSPWYWWADVPPDRKTQLFVAAGPLRAGRAGVKYRGIFLNDEAPEPLPGWAGDAQKDPADFNHASSTRTSSRSLLRLKGNYLWPAMWNNAFAEDDPENPRLADEYGIVMGTSHQEPMLRAQKEWDWHLTATRQLELRSQRSTCCASSGATASAHGSIREHLHHRPARRNDSRWSPVPRTSRCWRRSSTSSARIIAEVDRQGLHRKMPQLWASTRKCRNYYDNGLRVPDDVTLLWAEDNWGNVRRLPARGGPHASGRRRRLLPLRLRRRPAQLQVDEHQPDARRSGSR